MPKKKNSVFCIYYDAFVVTNLYIPYFNFRWCTADICGYGCTRWFPSGVEGCTYSVLLPGDYENCTMLPLFEAHELHLIIILMIFDVARLSVQVNSFDMG